MLPVILLTQSLLQSIHADIAFTLGNYLYQQLRPNGTPVHINVTNLEVLKGLVSNQNPDTPQLIQVRAYTHDIDSNTATLTWYNVHAGKPVEDPFASATIVYCNAEDWLTSWVPTAHLVQGRIQDLERLADVGLASRLSNSMAYQLFAKNLVDYAAVYRGMRSVVMHGLEAFADVTLASELSHGGHGGRFTIPPYFIDSVAHLAGFVMNVSDELDTGSKFSVTPGWRSMRLAKPLLPGGNYRSYVKMIANEEDRSVYFGDVYILQDGEIMGMVGGIQFRRYPRILLSRFFSAPDGPKDSSDAHTVKPAATKKDVTSLGVNAAIVPSKPSPVINGTSPPTVVNNTNGIKHTEHATAPVAAVMVPIAASTTAKAIQVVASEAALDLIALTDDASFVNLGIDSLMSLVIAEKFREQLGVVVNGSLFLEYPTIGDLRAWLDEYYS